jgi:hypothetical protein
MKKRSILISILAVIVCLSLVLVGCSSKTQYDDDDDYDRSNNRSSKVNKDPENDVKVISEAIGNKSIYEILTSALKSIPESVNDLKTDVIVDEIKNIEFETDAKMSVNGSKFSEIYIGVSDGITKVKTEEETVYMAIAENGDVISFEDFGNGYHETDRSYTISEMLDYLDEYISEYEEMDVDSILGMYAGTPVEEILDFKLPALNEEYLSIEEGYYVIQDSYYDILVDGFIDLVVETMDAEMGYATDEDAIEEAEEFIDDMIDALGLEIGFAVIGDNIVGILFSIDIDLEAYGDMNEEDGGLYPVSMNDDVCKIIVEIAYTEDASRLEQVNVYADMNQDGEQITKIDAECRIDDNEYSLEIDKFIIENDIDVSGTISLKQLVGDDGDIVGIDAEIALEMDDITVDGKAYVNFENLSKKGSEFIDLQLDMTIYGEVIDIELDAEVIDTGIASYEFSYEGEKEEIVIKGDMNFNSVDLGKIPSSVKNAS